MKNYLKNSSNIVAFKPWKTPGPHDLKLPTTVVPEHVSATREKGSFTSPMGYKTDTIKCRLLTSVFKEADAAEIDARVLEYYEYAMQSVSILIVLPNDHNKEIPSTLETELPTIYDKLTEQKVTVVLPSLLYWLLKKAKVSKKSKKLKCLLEKMDPEPRCFADIPSGREFKVSGPFALVFYDQLRKRVLGTNRIYDMEDIGPQVIGMIRKFKASDKQLMKKACQSNAPLRAEQSSNVSLASTVDQLSNANEQSDQTVIDNESVLSGPSMASVETLNYFKSQAPESLREKGVGKLKIPAAFAVEQASPALSRYRSSARELNKPFALPIKSQPPQAQAARSAQAASLVRSYFDSSAAQEDRSVVQHATKALKQSGLDCMLNKKAELIKSGEYSSSTETLQSFAKGASARESYASPSLRRTLSVRDY